MTINHMLLSPASFQAPVRRSEFDLLSAQRYAREGRIEDWVHIYLLSGPWANPGFSQGLKSQPRWWNGPLEVKLSSLSPSVGPEPWMEFVVDQAYWAARVRDIAASFTDPYFVPPLIVEYRDGSLSVRDGNTRYGAMKWLGWSHCWVVIWYNSEADHQQHSESLWGSQLVYLADRGI